MGRSEVAAGIGNLKFPCQFMFPHVIFWQNSDSNPGSCNGIIGRIGRPMAREEVEEIHPSKDALTLRSKTQE
jgi:hypothetical protein